MQKLSIVRLCGYTRSQQYLFLCRCSCGGETIATAGDIQRCHVSSCGCNRKERMRELHRKAVCGLCGAEYNQKIYIANKPQTAGMCGRCSHRVRAKLWARERRKK